MRYFKILFESSIFSEWFCTCFVDIAKGFDGSGKIAESVIQEVIDEYRKAGENFLNKNYEKALGLFLDEKAIIKKFNKKLDSARSKNDLNTSRQLRDLIKILDYSREISMLVR